MLYNAEIFFFFLEKENYIYDTYLRIYINKIKKNLIRAFVKKKKKLLNLFSMF